MQVVHAPYMYPIVRPVYVPRPVPVMVAAPSANFDNRGGVREIEANGLNNAGTNAKMNIGTSAVDNSLGGTHRTKVNGLDNSGYGGEVNIGLQNLNLFDNRGGERHITADGLWNGGDYAKMNIGQMGMLNNGGRSNVGVNGLDNTGYMSEVNIGLQNLGHTYIGSFVNDGYKSGAILGGADLQNLGRTRAPLNPSSRRHTHVDTFTNTGFKGGVDIGGSDMLEGEDRTINVDHFTDNGFKNNNSIGHAGARETTIGHIVSAGQNSVTEIHLI